MPDPVDHHLPGATPGPATADLARTAQRLGAHRDRELALFELCGRWSADGSADAARGFFATQSSLHAWRAEQWAARAPASVLLEVPGDPALERFRSAVAGATELTEDSTRLAAWSLVFIPALAAAYDEHRRDLAPAADRGVARLLGICIDDLGRQRGSGDALAMSELDALGAGGRGAVASSVRELWDRLLDAPGG